MEEKPTRIAVIDLGTNTFHLLIAEYSKHAKAEIIYHQTVAVKLGEGGISDGLIAPEAIERGINALTLFKESIDNYQVSIIKSAATSAIRSAKNGVGFIERVKEATGLDLDIIDGEREAELIYKGVRAAIRIQEISLIVDIGGGSVELIICDNNRIFWKKSYPIGAARVMARFHKTDPISISEITLLNTFLADTLTDLKAELEVYQPTLLIGSAGAFETFAALQDAGYKASFENPEQAIDLDKFRLISRLILKSTHAERRKMAEIPDVRVDMIVVATIMTDFLIEMTGIKSLKVSSYSLKEGVLFETVM